MKQTIRTYLVDQNYNCAESMLRWANSVWELGLSEETLRAVGGFGGGMGCGNLCGAIAGSIAALSLKYQQEDGHASPIARKKAAELMERFTQELGSNQCQVLSPQYRKPQVKCLSLVEHAAGILEDITKEG